MTLLSDVVRVLHDAQVAAYTVHSAVDDLPGGPDLVVIIEAPTEDEAVGVLTAAELPISAVRKVGAGVLHVWQRPPSD